MVRRQGYTTSQRRQHKDRTPYHREHAETGIGTRAGAVLVQGASMHIDATDATVPNTRDMDALRGQRKALRRQRQEWAEFLAEEATEAATRQHIRKPRGKHKKEGNGATGWSKVREKRKREITSTDQNTSSQPKAARRYTQDKPPDNFSARSTVTAVPPPSYP